MIISIGGGPPLKPHVFCRGCGLAVKIEVQAQVKSGRLCADCVRDALAQFIKASGIDPADTTLLDFLVKFGHGEMPDDTSLQTFLDYLWAKVKGASQTSPASVNPRPTIAPLTEGERRHLIAIRRQPFCDLSMEILRSSENPELRNLCKKFQAVPIKENRVAMRFPEDPIAIVDLQVYLGRFTAIGAHYRQINDALKLLGIE